MNFSKTILTIAATLLFATHAGADSMRCGEYVIQDDDLQNTPTMEEVIEKCGQPDSREGQSLYYKEKGKRLDFDTEGRLITIADIEED
jgi:hypothetical protein